MTTELNPQVINVQKAALVRLFSRLLTFLEELTAKVRRALNQFVQREHEDREAGRSTPWPAVIVGYIIGTIFG